MNVNTAPNHIIFTENFALGKDTSPVWRDTPSLVVFTHIPLWHNSVYVAENIVSEIELPGFSPKSDVVIFACTFINNLLNNPMYRWID